MSTLTYVYHYEAETNTQFSLWAVFSIIKGIPESLCYAIISPLVDRVCLYNVSVWVCEVLVDNICNLTVNFLKEPIVNKHYSNSTLLVVGNIFSVQVE